MKTEKHVYMQEAIGLSELSLSNPEFGPFGAVIVQNGIVVGRGHNEVIALNDPTAHAEVMAIRNACSQLETFQLDDCDIYTSCEPCPMCLGAIYWSRIRNIYYGNTCADADDLGFSDVDLYEEIGLPIAARKIPMVQLMDAEAKAVFEKWTELPHRRLY